MTSKQTIKMQTKVTIILLLLAVLFSVCSASQKRNIIVPAGQCKILDADIKLGVDAVGCLSVLSDGINLHLNVDLNADVSTVLAIKSYKIYTGLVPLQLNLLGIPILGQYSLVGQVEAALCSTLNLSPLLSALGLSCGLPIHIAVNVELVYTITGQCFNAWAVSGLDLSANISLLGNCCCP